MSTPEGGEKGKKRRKDLDEPPYQPGVTPWEREVLERARKSSFYRAFTLNTEEEDSFLKLGVYATELNKLRLLRGVAHEEYSRNRHNQPAEHALDSPWATERMQRRAQRFGTPATLRPAVGEKRKCLMECADDAKTLEKRRKTLASELRQNCEIADAEMTGLRDAARMQARAKRFGLQRGCSRWERSGNRGGVEAVEEAGGQSFKEWETAGESWGDRNDRFGGGGEDVSDAMTMQRWELEGEDWGAGVDSSGEGEENRGSGSGGARRLQSWEARGEDW